MQKVLILGGIRASVIIKLEQVRGQRGRGKWQEDAFEDNNKKELT